MVERDSIALTGRKAAGLLLHPPPERMRGRFRTLGTVLCLSLAILALLFFGTRPRPARSTPNFGSTFDAGPLFVTETKRLTHTFTVENTTSVPIAILGETHDCSCTDIKLPVGVLAPGATVPLEVQLNVPFGFGAREATCTVETDYPPQPRWTYRLRYQSFLPSRIDPSRIEFERSVDDSQSELQAVGEAWLELYRRPGERFPLPLSVRHQSYVAVRLHSDTVREVLDCGVVRVRYPIEIRLSENHPPGSFAHEVTFPFDDGTSADLIVQTRVEAPITAVPALLHFGVIRPNVPVERALLVRATDGRPFAILELEVKGSAALAITQESNDKTQPQRQHQHAFRVGLCVDQGKSIAHAGEVVVITDHPRFPVISIPWSAFVACSGQDSSSTGLSVDYPLEGASR